MFVKTSLENRLDSGEVIHWLVLKFADWLEVDPDDLDSNQPISNYGLDSISAVTLSVQLEEELGIQLDTALLWDYPTIASLADHLTDKLNEFRITELPASRTGTIGVRSGSIA